MSKFILFCLLVPTLVSAAELVEIPLEVPFEGDTGILWVRPDWDYRLTFDAGRTLEDITDVKLRLSGSYSCFGQLCWQFGGYGGTQVYTCYDPAIRYGLLVDDTYWYEAGYQFADVSGDASQVETVEFTLDLQLAEDPADVGWTQFATGAGTVFVRGQDCPSSSYPTVCICDESAQVWDASLLVTLGSSVPTNDRSWSTIKALYR